MSDRRMDMHRLQELVRLHRMRTPCRDVARLLCMSPNTERTYREALIKAELLAGEADALPELEALRQAVLTFKPPKQAPQQISTVEPWADQIETMLRRKATPTAIFDFLRLQHPEFHGSLSAVKRLCRRLRQDQGVDPAQVAIPVLTEPGQVAQVDFGYLGRLFDPLQGTWRKAWVFVMVLGYSRHLFAEIVFDQRTETWLDLHVAAFRYFGGAVDTLVPDNLKAAVIRAAFGVSQDTGLNRSYRELARFFGCKIEPTPPKAPKKKGKVESAVKYVKRNFFAPRGEMEVNQAKKELACWLMEIAGTRTHGTTHRKPIEMFEREERATLKPLPLVPFESVVWKPAKIHPDSHASFERRLYSAPWPYIGKSIWIRATPSTVCLYYEETRIATHRRHGLTSHSTIPAHLPAHRSEYRVRSREYWEQKADRISPEVGAYIREVFDSDDVLSRLRTVQAMVTHLESFPVERARAACERARYFGNYSYRGIKDILRRALDREPLPQVADSCPAALPSPRFARTTGDLFLKPLEVSHASN